MGYDYAIELTSSSVIPSMRGTVEYMGPLMMNIATGLIFKSPPSSSSSSQNSAITTTTQSPLAHLVPNHGDIAILSDAWSVNMVLLDLLWSVVGWENRGLYALAQARGAYPAKCFSQRRKTEDDNCGRVDVNTLTRALPGLQTVLPAGLRQNLNRLRTTADNLFNAQRESLTSNAHLKGLERRIVAGHPGPLPASHARAHAEELLKEELVDLKDTIAIFDRGFELLARWARNGTQEYSNNIDELTGSIIPEWLQLGLAAKIETWS